MHPRCPPRLQCDLSSRSMVQALFDGGMAHAQILRREPLGPNETQEERHDKALLACACLGQRQACEQLYTHATPAGRARALAIVATGEQQGMLEWLLEQTPPHAPAALNDALAHALSHHQHGRALLRYGADPVEMIMSQPEEESLFWLTQLKAAGLWLPSLFPDELFAAAANIPAADEEEQACLVLVRAELERRQLHQHLSSQCTAPGSRPLRI